MTKLVIDASVAVKWVVDEEWSSESIALLGSDIKLSAPDHLIAEMANVVWKYQQRGWLTGDEALARARSVGKVPVRLEPSAGLVEGAIQIACEWSIAAYDALYVQLALSEGIQLVTVDDHLIRKLEQSSLRHAILHMKDLRLPGKWA